MKNMWSTLIDGAKNNDQDAFYELYQNSYDSVYRTVKSMVRDEDTAMDIVQDTFVKGFASLSALEDPESFLPWIKRIATNKAKDWFKKKQAIPLSQLADEEGNEPDFEDDRVENLPDEVMDRNETTRLIEEILSTLSDEQRIAVGMFYYQQMSVTEIAQELGVSENTVKSRLSYARKKIKVGVEELEKKGTKLYSLAPIPFLMYLFRNQILQASAGNAPAAVFGNIMAQSAAQVGSAAAAGGAAATAATGGATAAAGSAGGGLLSTVGAKIVAVVLSVSLIAGGIGLGLHLTNRETSQPEVEEEQKAEVVGPRKLTVGIPQYSTIPDYNTNALSVYLEEVTDIDIEWVYFASSPSSYAAQLTLMCYGNDELPDVIIGMKGLDHYLVNELGENGYLIDLKDLIEDYAPNYKEHLKQCDKDMRKYVKEKGTNAANGSFYAMPSFSIGDGIDQQQSMIQINKTWLDKLGLKVPTNVTELVNVCRAFQTMDPNGNGEADEIPMLGGAALRAWILNAYVEYEEGNLNVKGGKVWDPIVTDEFRQGLIFINDLVQEGLLSEFGFTYSTTQMRDLISPTDGPGKVGVFCGDYERMTNASGDVLNDFVAIGALADETGKGGYNIILETEPAWCNFITKDCENPALAMEFLDALYSDESITRQRWGEKDIDWVYEEGKNMFGTKSYAKVINTEAWFDGSLNKTFTIYFGIATHWNFLQIKQEAKGRQAEVLRLGEESWNLMHNPNNKVREGAVSRLVYTAEEYKVFNNPLFLGISSTNGWIVPFMNGEKNPRDDAAWNEFKSNLQNSGREDIMRAVQSAYDRKVAK